MGAFEDIQARARANEEKKKQEQAQSRTVVKQGNSQERFNKIVEERQRSTGMNEYGRGGSKDVHAESKASAEAKVEAQRQVFNEKNKAAGGISAGKRRSDGSRVTSVTGKAPTITEEEVAQRQKQIIVEKAQKQGSQSTYGRLAQKISAGQPIPGEVTPQSAYAQGILKQEFERKTGKSVSYSEAERAALANPPKEKQSVEVYGSTIVGVPPEDGVARLKDQWLTSQKAAEERNKSQEFVIETPALVPDWNPFVPVYDEANNLIDYQVKPYLKGELIKTPYSAEDIDPETGMAYGHSGTSYYYRASPEEALLYYPTVTSYNLTNAERSKLAGEAISSLQAKGFQGKITQDAIDKEITNLLGTKYALQGGYYVPTQDKKELAKEINTSYAVFKANQIIGGTFDSQGNLREKPSESAFRLDENDVSLLVGAGNKESDVRAIQSIGSDIISMRQEEAQYQLERRNAITAYSNERRRMKEDARSLGYDLEFVKPTKGQIERGEYQEGSLVAIYIPRKGEQQYQFVYHQDPLNPHNVTREKVPINVKKGMPGVVQPGTEFGAGIVDTFESYKAIVTGEEPPYTVTQAGIEALRSKSAGAGAFQTPYLQIDLGRVGEVIGEAAKNPERAAGQVYGEILLGLGIAKAGQYAAKGVPRIVGAARDLKSGKIAIEIQPPKIKTPVRVKASDPLGTGISETGESRLRAALGTYKRIAESGGLKASPIQIEPPRIKLVRKTPTKDGLGTEIEGSTETTEAIASQTDELTTTADDLLGSGQGIEPTASDVASEAFKRTRPPKISDRYAPKPPPGRKPEPPVATPGKIKRAIDIITDKPGRQRAEEMKLLRQAGKGLKGKERSRELGIRQRISEELQSVNEKKDPFSKWLKDFKKFGGKINIDLKGTNVSQRAESKAASEEAARIKDFRATASEARTTQKQVTELVKQEKKKLDYGPLGNLKRKKSDLEALGDQMATGLIVEAKTLQKEQGVTFSEALEKTFQNEEKKRKKRKLLDDSIGYVEVQQPKGSDSRQIIFIDTTTTTPKHTQPGKVEIIPNMPEFVNEKPNKATLDIPSIVPKQGTVPPIVGQGIGELNITIPKQTDLTIPKFDNPTIPRHDHPNVPKNPIPDLVRESRIRLAAPPIPISGGLDWSVGENIGTNEPIGLKRLSVNNLLFPEFSIKVSKRTGEDIVKPLDLGKVLTSEELSIQEMLYGKQSKAKKGKKKRGGFITF